MAGTLAFTKMQGCGNDYVYVNGFTETVDNPSSLAGRVSDRHFGIGSDGLVLILPSDAADVRMRMFNPDGSEAQMCGNAVRCVARYAYERGLVQKTEVAVETRAGLRLVRLHLDAGIVTGATVDMGLPELEPAKIPLNLSLCGGGDLKAPYVDRPLDACGRIWRVTCASMGNPHAVVFLTEGGDRLEKLDLPAIGPSFENHPLFPERTNTEFVYVASRSTVDMRVWERGTGETLACGTGACATAVACVLNGFTERLVDVRLKGGTLRIEWSAENGHVFMTGPCEPVFDGVLLL